MQFINDGPDIPNELLQAHEEGRVVFFCGAGISYPAGLPGFKGLVEQVYQLCHTQIVDAEKTAFDQNQYDITLNLLERRLPGQRLEVRANLFQALQPPKKGRVTTVTQEALLQLGRDRSGKLRLVTTNFDRLFHRAAKRMGKPFESYAAPMLPIPKISRWDGLVFLHGLLPQKEDDTALSRLVVTSGDFGLAYLTERWASRFVSELFRNYTVCFVGYSIDDPVLRYMMDALAADRMLGENTPPAWALAGSTPDQNEQEFSKWEARGVKPILYNSSQDHSALHNTLTKWAETYRDGIQGKETIVSRHAQTVPQRSTAQDDFVGRMLWAIADESGLPAKCFAEFNPAPPLEWLLGPFSIAPNEGMANQQGFIVNRPTPSHLAENMRLVYRSNGPRQLDEVLEHMARWLTRHLNDPELILWVSEQGGHLNYRFKSLIENKLQLICSLERDGKIQELDKIRSESPNAIPDARMRTLWRLLLSGRVRSSDHESGLYRLIECFK